MMRLVLVLSLALGATACRCSGSGSGSTQVVPPDAGSAPALDAGLAVAAPPPIVVRIAADVGTLRLFGPPGQQGDLGAPESQAAADITPSNAKAAADRLEAEVDAELAKP